MIYYWNKKLKKRLCVLKADIITIKKDTDFISLAQRMHFLQDIFQMTAIVLMTHLNSSSEVVNHPYTLFFSVRHESSDWWPLWVQQWIVDCSHTYYPSRTPRNKNLWGFRLGECGDHSGLWPLLINWLGLSHSIVMLAVCGVAPSFWNHFTSRLTP